MKFFAKYREQYVANLRLAVPVALSQLGFIATTFADNAMVGAFGGEETTPLSAVSFGGIIGYIIYFFGLGISLGITPLVGEIFVRGDRIGSARYLQSAIVLYSVLGIVLAALQWSLSPMLYCLGQPVEVVDMAIPYYRLMALTLPPTMLFGAFKQFLEGVGNTRVAMAILVSTNMLNILLNWVFIFGHWGFAPMGVFGAGLATLVARIVNPILIIAYFVCVRKSRDYLALFSRTANMVRHSLTLLKIGLPIAGQMVLEASAWVVTSVMMGWFGSVAISANQIGVTYGNCTFMLVLSLGSAATIRVSHCLGLRDFDRMRKAISATLQMAVVWNIFVASCFVVFRHWLPLAFSDNVDVAALAAQMIILFALYQIPDAIQCMLVGVLRGLKDVRPIAYISFAAYIAINIPVGYLFAFTFGLGARGLIYGYVFGLSTAAVLYSLRVRSTLRRITAQNSKSFH